MIEFDSTSFPYISTARAAHGLASRLKRLRPEFREDISALECIVTSSHRQMQAARTSPEIAQAWGNLNAAYQTLLALRKVHRT